jgi:exonuclease 3'-5' domain-containing protein 1
MANTSSDYILCADDQSLAEAISAIESSSAIILDCEGKDLGQDDGSLSLISFRIITPKPSKTYLIDTISLARDKLKPIFDIIQSSSPTKIVFDGRMDFSALYHEYNITMGGVLDLQLADIYSRPLRGETQDRQLRRLSPFLHIGAVLGQRSSYTALHKLCGLEQCISEHGIVTDSPKGDQLGKKISSLNTYCGVKSF